MKKGFMIFLALLLVSISNYVPVSAEDIFTGDAIPAFNTAERVVAVAMNEVGYIEGEGNNSKYGKWNGQNYVAWCGSFVSWCAHKAGVPTSSVKSFSDNCDAEYEWFQSKNRAEDSDYIPKAGDIIFIDSDYKYDHSGIVVAYKDGIVYTVEGNASDMVKAKEYSMDDERIIGYGIPEYNESEAFPTDSDISNQTVSLNSATLRLEKGDKSTLKALVSPQSVIKTKVWTTSDPLVCTVNYKGVIVGKSAGTAYITVEITNGKTAKCKVIVK